MNAPIGPIPRLPFISVSIKHRELPLMKYYTFYNHSLIINIFILGNRYWKKEERKGPRLCRICKRNFGTPDDEFRDQQRRDFMLKKKENFI